MRNLLARFAHVLILFSLLSCQQQQSMEPYTMTDALKQDLALVQSARIFFGHQSVGGNIMDGVQDILKASGTQLTVLDIAAGTDSLPPTFLLYTPVGKNTEPKTKCDDFKRSVDRQLAGKLDIALLKFCYIDIDTSTNIDKLFDYYRSVLDDLKARHPDITFVHVTAALRQVDSGPGVWVRELIGKPNRAKLDNLKRHAFNEKLRSTYAADPIFDLAASESTYPGGRRESFTYAGQTGYALIGAHTYDGGHLNEAGRQHVAADSAQPRRGHPRAPGRHRLSPSQLMARRSIFSVIESPTHPDFSPGYKRLGLEHVRLTSTRKVIVQLKEQTPDFVVAEFFYGYGNNYAGVNISNLDVLLFSLQKYAPRARVIVLVDKGERQYMDKLNEILLLHAVFVLPVQAEDISTALTG